jgi:hypothetical protein
LPLICRSRVNPTAHARPNWHDPTPTQETRALAAGPPVYSDRVPKGQRENPSPISKNQKRKKGIGRSAGKRMCLSPAPGMRPWRGLATPRRRRVSRTLAHCAPHIAKFGTPAMTRPVAARIAHTGRTAALSGPHRLEWGAVDRRRGSNFKKSEKGRPDLGSGQHREIASAQVDPVCSPGNESISGKMAGRRLKSGLPAGGSDDLLGLRHRDAPTRARARHSVSFEMRRRAGTSGWPALWVD